MNPLGKRTLDLKSLKITRIENLILTRDQNDEIDLTDNDIQVLGNFSFMPNLRSLNLSNNRIQKIEVELSRYIPNLETLVMTNNSMQLLGDLEGLFEFENLRFLSLVDNLIYNFKYYRLFVIHKIPSVRVLDFQKVTEKERKAALELFSGEEGIKLLDRLLTKTSTVEDTVKKTVFNLPSEEEKIKIKEAIKNAKTLNEIAKLEQQLAGGQVDF